MRWMSSSFDRYALEADYTVFLQPLPSCRVFRESFDVLALPMDQACYVLGDKEKSAHIQIPSLSFREEDSRTCFVVKCISKSRLWGVVLYNKM